MQLDNFDENLTFTNVDYVKRINNIKNVNVNKKISLSQKNFTDI